MKELIAFCRRRQKQPESLELARLLHEAFVSRVWEAKFDSWQDYLKQDGVKISPALDSRLRFVYRRYIVNMNVPLNWIENISYTNLVTAASAIADVIRYNDQNVWPFSSWSPRQKARIKNILDKAKKLSQRDLIQFLKECRY